MIGEPSIVEVFTHAYSRLKIALDHMGLTLVSGSYQDSVWSLHVQITDMDKFLAAYGLVFDSLKATT